MKYMGWSYVQLQACPDWYLDLIAEMARAEADAARAARHK